MENNSTTDINVSTGTILNKRNITIFAIVLVILLVIAFVFIKAKAYIYAHNLAVITAATQTTQKPLIQEQSSEGDLVKYPPIKPEDAEIYKKQLEEVVKNGDPSNCITLSDIRYQLLCENLFKSINNNSTATGTNIDKK